MLSWICSFEPEPPPVGRGRRLSTCAVTRLVVARLQLLLAGRDVRGDPVQCGSVHPIDDAGSGSVELDVARIVERGEQSARTASTSSARGVRRRRQLELVLDAVRLELEDEESMRVVRWNVEIQCEAAQHESSPREVVAHRQGAHDAGDAARRTRAAAARSRWPDRTSRRARRRGVERGTHGRFAPPVLRARAARKQRRGTRDVARSAWNTPLSAAVVLERDAASADEQVALDEQRATPPA